MRGRRVTQRHQLASFVYADGKSLLGAGALAGGIEHLRTGKSQLHRSLDLFRRRRGEQRVAPLKSLRAKGATYEWTNDAHIFLWQTEGVGNDSLQLFDPARALVNEHPVRRLPFRSSRICLDRVVIFDRRRIYKVDLVRRSRERCVNVAAFDL